MDYPIEAEPEKRLKVARVGTNFLEVPPRFYGGTERIMASLSAHQALQGHEIWLYAAKGSGMLQYTRKLAEKYDNRAALIDEKNRIVTIYKKDSQGNLGEALGALHLRESHYGPMDFMAPLAGKINRALIKQVVDEYQTQRKKQGRGENGRPFDCFHLHARDQAINMLSNDNTLRERLIVHEHGKPQVLMNKKIRYDYPSIAISGSLCQQFNPRKTHSYVQGVAYHGIQNEPSFDKASETTAGYLAFIGRFEEEKGAHRAIEIARKAGRPLLIAGTIDVQKQQDFFKENIEGRLTVDLSDPMNQVKYLGEEKSFADWLKEQTSSADIERKIAEIGERAKAERGKSEGSVVLYIGGVDEVQKRHFFRHAEVSLMPITWREPFGMVMAESMRESTPVIAYSHSIHLPDSTIGEKGGYQQNGSVPEVIFDERDIGQKRGRVDRVQHITGYKIEAKTPEEGITKSVEKVNTLFKMNDEQRRTMRQGVRMEFERNWTAEREAEDVMNIIRQRLGVVGMDFKKTALNNASGQAQGI